MSEIITVEEHLPEKKPGFFDLGPAQMVQSAHELAKVLSDIIEKKKLYKTIGPKKHILVDAWATLGSLLGILPKEEKVIRHDDGSWEAYISLINMKTGVVVGGGSAICSPEERNWRGRDAYAIRSMAITRATGKAYRLCFGWIPVLADYSATPAEEMSDETTSFNKGEKADGPARASDNDLRGNDEARPSRKEVSRSKRVRGGTTVAAVEALRSLAEKRWGLGRLPEFLKEAFGSEDAEDLSSENCKLAITTIDKKSFDEAMAELRFTEFSEKEINLDREF